MGEKEPHKKLKKKLAGKHGETEVPLSGGQRLDAANKDTAFEIENSGNPDLIKLALKRLDKSKKPKKVLAVPQKDFEKGIEIMKDINFSGTIRNLGGTNKKHIRKKPKSSKRK